MVEVSLANLMDQIHYFIEQMQLKGGKISEIELDNDELRVDILISELGQKMDRKNNAERYLLHHLHELYNYIEKSHRVTKDMSMKLMEIVFKLLRVQCHGYFRQLGMAWLAEGIVNYFEEEVQCDVVFDVIIQHGAEDFKMDIKWCITIFNILVQDGRMAFTKKVAKCVLSWYTVHDEVKELDSMLMNVLKRSPFELECMPQLVVLLSQRCDVAWKNGTLEVGKRYLNLFGGIVNYGYANAISNLKCLQTLCCMVNEDGHVTWNIMKILLKSNCSQRVLAGCITLLENPMDNSPWVLRGAVFFVGMSCWGSQRMEQLHFSWGHILPSLLSALHCKHAVVVFEVILSVQRLVKKFGDVVRVEWDIIFEILAQLQPWLTKTNHDASSILLDAEHNGFGIQHTRIPKELIDTISLIEELYARNEFYGDIEQLYSLLDMYAEHLGESTLLLLLKHHALLTHPARDTRWLQHTQGILERYFIPGINLNVRLETIQIVKSVLLASKNMEETKFVQLVVMPYLSQVYNDACHEVRLAGLQIVIDAIHELESIQFSLLLQILESAIFHANMLDAQIAALHGIIQLFRQLFDTLRYAEGVTIYSMITSIVQCHQDDQIRKIAMVCMEQVATADEMYRMQWTRNGKVVCSRFLVCSKNYGEKQSVLPIHLAFSAMLNIVNTDPFSNLCSTAMNVTKTMLRNSYVIRDIIMDDAAIQLISSLKILRRERLQFQDGALQFGAQHSGEAPFRNVSTSKINNHMSCLAIGYSNLVLHAGDAALTMSDFVLDNVVQCFFDELQIPLDNVKDDTKLAQDDSHVGLVPNGFSTKARSASSGFTAKVLGRLHQSNSREAFKAASKIHHRNNYSLQLKRNLLQGVVIIAMSGRLTNAHVCLLLPLLCESVDSILYTCNMETILSLLDINGFITEKTHLFKIVDAARVGFESPCNTARVLAFRVLLKCISTCSVGDRPTLAKHVMQFLREVQVKNLLVQAAIDFVSRITFYRNESLPHCKPARPPRNLIFFQDDNGQTKTWFRGNSIITVTTGKIGYADVTIRRATGTTQWLIKMQGPYDHENRVSSFPLPVANPIANSDSGDLLRRSKSLHNSSTSDSKLPATLSHSAPNSPIILPVRRSGLSTTAGGSTLIKRRFSDGVRNKASVASSTALVCNSMTRRGLLHPLPAYDGNGGSPSFFVEQSTINPEVKRDTLPPYAEPQASSDVACEVRKIKIKDDVNSPCMDPSYFMMQIHDYCEEGTTDLLESLPGSAALTRSLNVLDRTPGIDTHKVGVVFVDRHQQTELEILGNTCGSASYCKFLQKLGTVLKLSNFEGYSGGLDTTNCDDGEYCISWEDDCVLSIFHVATMMKAVEHTSMGQSILSKKRHIGNDHVHIIFNESGFPYRPDTIVSQFNYVHIIIEPLRTRNFRVTVLTKQEIPSFGPLQGVHLVPFSLLAPLVRRTALNADIACRIHLQNTLHFVSNAEQRIQLMTQLRQRIPV